MSANVGVGFIPILTFCEIISQTSQLGCQKLSAVCKGLRPRPYIGTIRMYGWPHLIYRKTSVLVPTPTFDPSACMIGIFRMYGIFSLYIRIFAHKKENNERFRGNRF